MAVSGDKTGDNPETSTSSDDGGVRNFAQEGKSGASDTRPPAIIQIARTQPGRGDYENENATDQGSTGKPPNVFDKILPACFPIDANLDEGKHQQIARNLKKMVNEIAQKCGVLFYPVARTVKNFPFTAAQQLQPDGSESKQVNQMSLNGCPTHNFGTNIKHSFSQAIVNHNQLSDQMCKEVEPIVDKNDKNKIIGEKLKEKTGGCAEVADYWRARKAIDDAKKPGGKPINFYGMGTPTLKSGATATIVDGIPSPDAVTMMHEALHALGGLHGSEAGSGVGWDEGAGGGFLNPALGCELIRDKASDNANFVAWDPNAMPESYYSKEKQPDSQLDFNELKTGKITMNGDVATSSGRAIATRSPTAIPSTPQAVVQLPPTAAVVMPPDNHRPPALTDPNKFFANKAASKSDKPPATGRPSSTQAPGERNSRTLRFRARERGEHPQDPRPEQALAQAQDPGERNPSKTVRLGRGRNSNYADTAGGTSGRSADTGTSGRSVVLLPESKNNTLGNFSQATSQANLGNALASIEGANPLNKPPSSYNSIQAGQPDVKNPPDTEKATRHGTSIPSNKPPPTHRPWSPFTPFQRK